MKKIYVIKVFAKSRKKRHHCDEYNWVSDTPAFYFKKKVALEAVKINACDIHETIYDYAVVLELKQGAYTVGEEIQWFKYNKETKMYEVLEERPTFLNGVCFGI